MKRYQFLQFGLYGSGNRKAAQGLGHPGPEARARREAPLRSQDFREMVIPQMELANPITGRNFRVVLQANWLVPPYLRDAQKAVLITGKFANAERPAKKTIQQAHQIAK